MIQVNDSKPTVGVIDRKPKMDSEQVGGRLQTFEVILGRGMATGVPGHTYPEAITVISTRTA